MTSLGHGGGDANHPSKEDDRIKSDMNEITKKLSEVITKTSLIPTLQTELSEFKARVGSIDTNTESLDNGLKTLNTEFKGFGDFRDRIQGYEDAIRKRFWGGILGIITVIAGSAYYIGGQVNGIKGDISDSTKSIGRLEGSVEGIKTQIGKAEDRERERERDRLKSQGELLKSIAEIKSKGIDDPVIAKLSLDLGKAVVDGNKAVKEEVIQETKKSIQAALQDTRLVDAIVRPLKDAVAERRQGSISGRLTRDIQMDRQSANRLVIPFGKSDQTHDSALEKQGLVIFSFSSSRARESFTPPKIIAYAKVRDREIIAVVVFSENPDSIRDFEQFVKSEGPIPFIVTY